MNPSKEKIIEKFIIIVFVAAAIGILNPVGIVVKAAPMQISHSSLVMKKGTSKKVKVKNLPQMKVKVKWSTSNKYAATVSKKGKVRAIGYGAAVIKAKCGKKKFLCRVTIPDDSRTVTLNAASLTMAENTQYQLIASSANEVKYHSGNDEIAVVSSSGLIRAVNPGIVTITAKSATGYARCVVTVTSSDVNIISSEWAVNRNITAIRRLTKKNNFVYDNITWAKGKDITFKIANLDENTVKKCVWSISDSNIVSKPERASDCKIKASAKTLNPGTALVTAVVTDKNGKKSSYTNYVYVSAPAVNTNNITLLGPGAGSNRQQFISISGLSRYSKIKWTNSSANATLSSYNTKAAVWGIVPGTGVITAEVDGKTYKINYVVKNPVFNGINPVLAKGKMTKINIVGIEGIPVYYSSRNSNVAKVDSLGNITAVKAGVTYIDVRIGNMVFTYREEVAAKGIKTIINRADYIVNNWKYSQKKRMKKGYYDCSALVWKGYKAYKKYCKKLGSSKRALPAGELFDYLYAKNQIKYLGYTSMDDLQPGDLIFYGDYYNAVKYSTPGRTLDIYHVSMYAGAGRVIEKGGRVIDYNNIQDIVGVGRVVNG